MIKVLIVDDEPFIRQGLKIIIDWARYGYEICAEAANGNEAIDILQSQKVDLVIVDIKMPGMNGLELIEYIRNNVNVNMRFIILSGYYEFNYARQAIQYSVEDYILKPVQEKELIKIIQKIKDDYYRGKEREIIEKEKARIVYDRHLINLLYGKYTKKDISYVLRFLTITEGIRYISFEIEDEDETFSKLSLEEKLNTQRLYFLKLSQLLGEFSYHAICDVGKGEDYFSVGLIYTKELLNKSKLNKIQYVDKLYNNLKLSFPYDLKIYIGQKVSKIESISESYRSIAISRSFCNFINNQKIIYYYDDIPHRKDSHLGVGKQIIDQLIGYIKNNEVDMIQLCIDEIYDKLKKSMIETKFISAYIYYMICKLADLAKDLDSETDQEEVLQYISKEAFSEISKGASSIQFKKFALDFAEYLNQFRKSSSRGLLNKIEKDIQKNYMKNLSLKSLGKKYYINNVYLGQLFKKEYGVTFNDYLTSLRIDKAVDLLERTDNRIYTIASEVGFNSPDYFINKFVQIKGVTPHQYRKNL